MTRMRALALLLFPVSAPELFDAVVTTLDQRVIEIQVKQPRPTSNWVWGAMSMPGRVLHELRALWSAREGREEEQDRREDQDRHADVAEDAELDWKGERRTDEHAKDELAKDVAAMANSGGGVVVFGVGEEGEGSGGSGDGEHADIGQCGPCRTLAEPVCRGFERAHRVHRAFAGGPVPDGGCQSPLGIGDPDRHAFLLAVQRCSLWSMPTPTVEHVSLSRRGADHAAQSCPSATTL
jgi:hypothetical protein